jgi:hypothetical protein
LPATQRGGGIAGAHEIEAGVDTSGEPGALDAHALQGEGAGRGRLAQVAAQVEPALDLAAVHQRRRVVERQPITVEPQAPRHRMGEPGDAEIERADLQANVGAWGRQQRRAEFRLRPDGARPRRRGTAKDEGEQTAE